LVSTSKWNEYTAARVAFRVTVRWGHCRTPHRRICYSAFNIYIHTWRVFISRIYKSLYALRSLNKKVFSCRLKVANDSPGCRRPGGRSFQTRGPTTEKLLSPNLFWVRGTTNVGMSLELDRGGRRLASDISNNFATSAALAEHSNECRSSLSSVLPVVRVCNTVLIAVMTIVYIIVLCYDTNGCLQVGAIRQSKGISPTFSNYLKSISFHANSKCICMFHIFIFNRLKC